MLRSIIFCCTIWVLTALLAGFSGGTLWYYNLTGSIAWGEAFLLIFFATLVCSSPAMFIFWLIVLGNRTAVLLFRILLKAILVLASFCCSLIFVLPLGESFGYLFAFAACIVLSALSSVMMHHRAIVSFATQKNNSHV